MTAATERLLADFTNGKAAALARVISVVENHRPGADAILATLHSRTNRARRIGITGPPGAGKSTMVTQLISSYRAEGLTVGVIAVDPTSTFTGGALLGDRIRMEEVALDPGVYIRSLATRGALGGLSAATRDIADVLDAYGFDRILVETVGVGQSELEVARTVDTCVVVLVPESGDAIQTLKAGLMEIADVFVVNKADRPGADRLTRELKVMLKLRAPGAVGASPSGAALPSARAHALSAAASASAADDTPGGWVPPVSTAVASQGTGLTDVRAALDGHYEYLTRTGVLAERRRVRLRERVADVVERMVRSRLWRDAATNAWVDSQLGALESGQATPLQVADALLSRSGTLLMGGEKRP